MVFQNFVNAFAGGKMVSALFAVQYADRKEWHSLACIPFAARKKRLPAF